MTTRSPGPDTWRMAFCVHCNTLLFSDPLLGWRHEIEPTWPHRAHDLYIISEEPF